jgi:exodeoxyribonuclease VII large subunit
VSINLLPLVKDEGILSVSELSLRIKRKFQQDREMQDLWVRGEISNLTNHRSGHTYFTLKDSRSQIQCVMFKWYSRRLKFKPESGMKVLVFGSVDTYEARSQYQIQVMSLRPDGIGELYKAFEQLKIKLASEGLFDEAHKKPLPRYPRTLGVAASPTGAVIHDIINVTRRRFPVHIILAPTQVQGAEAACSIVNSINRLNKLGVDVIILARGGGSIEDLWPFNEEIVARAIYHCEVPVVSAVGHETDYTIADFVADLRAPTPSAAAELTVPDAREVRAQLTQNETMLHHAIQRKLTELSQRIARCESILSPGQLYALVDANRNRLREANRHMIRLIRHKTALYETRLSGVAGRLEAVSPLHTLQRGYSITLKEGEVVRSIEQVESGDSIEVRVADGLILSTVEEKERGELLKI